MIGAQREKWQTPLETDLVAPLWKAPQHHAEDFGSPFSTGLNGCKEHMRVRRPCSQAVAVNMKKAGNIPEIVMSQN